MFDLHYLSIIHSHLNLQRVAREMQTWSLTNHKNVQPLLGFCTDHDILPGAICLVSPWRENGNAREFIIKNPTTNRLTLVRTHHISSSLSRLPLVLKVREIAEGLEYLHREGIIHGDIRGVSVPFIFDFV
jgi:serine/threonine protein kinase